MDSNPDSDNEICVFSAVKYLFELCSMHSNNLLFEVPICGICNRHQPWTAHRGLGNDAIVFHLPVFYQINMQHFGLIDESKYIDR